jgi:hypothetical protein
MEYNRVLKQNSKMYIEVPAPDSGRRHELNPNHYSIMGSTQLSALIVRTGFDIIKFDKIDFDLTVDKDENDKNIETHETYYCILAEKKRPLDIK